MYGWESLFPDSLQGTWRIGADAHGTTMTILETLTSFKWDAKPLSSICTPFRPIEASIRSLSQDHRSRPSWRSLGVRGGHTVRFG
ncbi:unnamed protein product [Linum trigynum]|uniref:Uncharacterized protein n=1 Tax=Linum trigynum TaxID=586398 RepID=A0AAV2DF37_9ROSI